MPDEVDLATDIGARALERAIRAATTPIAAGVAGDCRSCDRFSPRLVGGRCAPCRDGSRR